MPGADVDVPTAPMCIHDEASTRWGRTRRSRRQHLSWDNDDTIGSAVFFTIKIGVIRFFPGFRALQSDLLFLQNTAQRLQANGPNNSALDEKATEFFQGPSRKRLAQRSWRTQRIFDNYRAHFLGKYRRTARTWLLLQDRYAVSIEQPEQLTHVFLVKMRRLCDLLHPEALCRHEHDLCAADRRPVLPAPKNPLKMLTFSHCQRANI